MNALIWFLRGVLFIILLGLAIKNSADVELRFYFDVSRQIPLSLALLAALVIGVVLGLLALVPLLFRQRRTIGALKHQLAKAAKPDASPGALATPTATALPPPGQ